MKYKSTKKSLFFSLIVASIAFASMSIYADNTVEDKYGLNGESSTRQVSVNILDNQTYKNVYGLGNDASTTGNSIVNVKGGTITENVYGVASSSTVGIDSKITVSGGNVEGDIYGASNSYVTRNTNVTLSGGTVGGDIYGASTNANIAGNLVVTLKDNAKLDGKIIAADSTSSITGSKTLNLISYKAEDGQSKTSLFLKALTL